MSEIAKMIDICRSDKVVHPDKCRSFDNGIDFFGIDDCYIDIIRKRHGECIDDLPLSPRLIIFTRKGTKEKVRPIYVKLNVIQTLYDSADSIDRRISILSNLARFGFEHSGKVSSVVDFDITVLDWGNQVDLEIDMIANYEHFNTLKKEYKKFIKRLA